MLSELNLILHRRASDFYSKRKEKAKGKKRKDHTAHQTPPSSFQSPSSGHALPPTARAYCTVNSSLWECLQERRGLGM